MAYMPTPKKYPKSSSAAMQTGGKAKESMPRKGARPATGKAKAKMPDFKVGGSYRSGRAIVGAPGTKARVSRAGAAREGGVVGKPSAAGRGKGADAMGSATARSSSAKAGAYAKPKAKAPRMRSMY